MVLISWFSSWRHMFNSFKWVIKSTKNAKCVSQFSLSCSSTNLFFWYHKWLDNIANHKIFSAFGLNLAIFFWKVNDVPIVSVNIFKVPGIGDDSVPWLLWNSQSWWWFARRYPFLKLLCIHFLDVLCNDTSSNMSCGWQLHRLLLIL